MGQARRHRTLLLCWTALAVLAGVAFAASAAAEPASAPTVVPASSSSAPTGAAKRSPSVICITKIKGLHHAIGAYRHRPRRCTLHQRGTEFVSLTQAYLFQMHWVHWGNHRAAGHGKRGVTGGKLPVIVKLRAPRSPCGPTVFTKAILRTRFSGRWHRGTMRLDDCLG
jgi:hypothetical protein